MAYRLSGEWLANWGGQICYLNGAPFTALIPTRYQVTAIDGLLDIQIIDGPRIGAGLQPDSDGTVAFTYRAFDQRICLPAGTPEEFVFAYTFTFQLTGTGSATSHWTYGLNTNCAVCTVDDNATLVRVGLPK